MKIGYFIIIGTIIGFCFALVDTIIGNAETSPVNPVTKDLLKNAGILKFFIYSIIGAVTGLALFGIFKRIQRQEVS